MTLDEIYRFEKSLAGTTNVLCAFVEDSGTGTRKPTMNAGDGGPPSAFIVATNLPQPIGL
jgi:hypothetical protein